MEPEKDIYTSNSGLNGCERKYLDVPQHWIGLQIHKFMRQAKDRFSRATQDCKATQYKQQETKKRSQVAKLDFKLIKKIL